MNDRRPAPRLLACYDKISLSDGFWRMNLLQRIPPPSIGAFLPFEDGEVEQSIPQRFEQQVRAYGDHLAVKWDRGSYDYAALNATANRLARAILSRSGNAAEPVALLFEHGGEALAAIMAVLKAGKFYVVLDPGYPPDRLEYMLEDSGARLMVTDAYSHQYARQLCGSTIELLRFDDVDRSLSGADLAAYPAPDALAMILYTSGSTGGPKGVMHSHRSILADARNHSNGWSITACDRCVLSASLSFASSVRTIYGSLLKGAAVLPYDAKKNGFGGLTPWLLDNEITIVRAVPTSFRSFMETLDEDQVFPAVRVLSAGGEPMLRSDVDQFNRHFLPHCVLSHAFGPTECLTVCWVLVPHGTHVAEGKLPIGRCVPDKEVVLLDESRREVAAGEVGEIAVRSRYLSAGYWRDPKRTRAAFLPDPGGGEVRTYLTGDLGRRGTDGILVHVGRRDFQVKIRGFRIEVAEIESALRAVKGIRDAVVVGRETEPGEMRLVAYFVASGAPPVSTRTLREHLAQTLPDYMMPSAFVAMAAIPQTPNGKTDRLRLPPPMPVRRDLDEPLKAPRNAIEVDLVAIWKEILAVDQLGIDDDFLSLGGDSLKAAQIAARMASRFRLEVPASAPLRLETVGRMAELVASLSRGR
jgi:amino acid adenylation domain-containing protein